MDNQSRKKHYRGSISEWYDRLLESETNDIEFYKRIAVETGGKVLELACGTGRLLVPIRQQGVDIEGLDISADMLDMCRQKLAAQKLTAPLYEQDMTSFDIGQRYQTIFISGGSFQLIEDLDEALATLKRICAHLHPGGRLVLDIFCPWDQIRRGQEGQWQIRRRATNTNQDELWCYECSHFDLEEQMQRMRTKYELYKHNQLVHTSCGEMNLRWYGKHEFILMLEKAGFGKIRTEAATIIERDGEALVYHAIKD